MRSKNECVSPVRVGTDYDWEFVTASDYHALGIKTDGSLWAWGDNQFGQLGLNTSNSWFSTPQRGNVK